MNGTVITICPFFRTDVHGLIFDCDFSGGQEVRNPHDEEIKFYWYAKSFDKNEKVKLIASADL